MLKNKAEEFLMHEYGNINNLEGKSYDELFDKAFTHAWRDTIAHERFNKESNVIKNKNDIYKVLKNEIYAMNCNSQQDFDNWHSTLCGNNLHDMRYGLWQKLINMTFKYLYCFNLCSLYNFKFIFEFCHCPIDTHVASIVCKKIKADECGVLNLARRIATSEKGYSWNFITEENYLQIEKTIKIICDKEKITPLQFDILYWQ